MLSHPPEDILEAYILGRLPSQQTGWDEDPELVAVEAHLLVCGQCVEAVELLEATASAIRETLELANPRRRAKPKVFTAGARIE